MSVHTDATQWAFKFPRAGWKTHEIQQPTLALLSLTHAYTHRTCTQARAQACTQACTQARTQAKQSFR